MLGSGMIVLGMYLAFSTSLTAVRKAPDRAFAIAALAVATCEAVALFAAAVWIGLRAA